MILITITIAIEDGVLISDLDIHLGTILGIPHHITMDGMILGIIDLTTIAHGTVHLGDGVEAIGVTLIGTDIHIGMEVITEDTMVVDIILDHLHIAILEDHQVDIQVEEDQAIIALEAEVAATDQALTQVEVLQEENLRMEEEVHQLALAAAEGMQYLHVHQLGQAQEDQYLLVRQLDQVQEDR